MERRVTSHTEEEEMNQRRRLLTLARKGDQKAVESLFELYQVRVFSGEALKKKKLPSFPLPTQAGPSGKGSGKGVKKIGKLPKSSPSETVPASTASKHPQDSKKKAGLPSKEKGKMKGESPSVEKPLKAKPPSSKQGSPKAGKSKKTVSVSKVKPKKSSLSARPARAKKK
ncbi:MAG: hypothetical protein KC592_01555 [Nitrospira sp.]|nr:hypothetical protein [Nitrospira sp.]HBP90684.1 hypothetical protein [Nitrospiraceae bacterium]HNP29359.1 hypothetical protein [Nitrospirales bacterium]